MIKKQLGKIEQMFQQQRKCDKQHFKKKVLTIFRTQSTTVFGQSFTSVRHFQVLNVDTCMYATVGSCTIIKKGLLRYLSHVL